MYAPRDIFYNIRKGGFSPERLTWICWRDTSVDLVNA